MSTDCLPPKSFARSRGLKPGFRAYELHSYESIQSYTAKTGRTAIYSSRQVHNTSY